MENKPNAVDPAADLAMLERAKSSVDLNQILDFGPWWYAPLFATMISCVTLFSQPDAGDWSFAYAALALTTAATISIHDFRRRQVRMRPSRRSFMVMLPVVLGLFGILAAWGTAVSTIGYERFVPGYAFAGWLTTSGLLLALRALLNAKLLRQAKI